MLEQPQSLSESLSHAECKQWWWDEVDILQEPGYQLLKQCQTPPNSPTCSTAPGTTPSAPSLKVMSSSTMQMQNVKRIVQEREMEMKRSEK